MAAQVKRILLADDDGDDREILEEAIRNIDPLIKMDTVANGAQAIDYLGTCADADLPCVVVLDYKMPVLSGAEVLDRMRIVPRYKDIPRFVWSSSSQPQYANACIEKGAAAYFVKPNNEKELTAIANRLVAVCHA